MIVQNRITCSCNYTYTQSVFSKLQQLDEHTENTWRCKWANSQAEQFNFKVNWKWNLWFGKTVFCFALQRTNKRRNCAHHQFIDASQNVNWSNSVFFFARWKVRFLHSYAFVARCIVLCITCEPPVLSPPSNLLGLIPNKCIFVGIFVDYTKTGNDLFSWEQKVKKNESSS